MATWEECNKEIEPIIPPPRPVPSGDSSIVRGTINATETESLDIEIPYSGSGYPIGIFIAVKDGHVSTASTMQPKSTLLFSGWKRSPDVRPDYDGSGDDDKFSFVLYHRSASSFLGTGSSNIILMKDEGTAGQYPHQVFRFRSDKVMSLYVGDNAGSYGLMPGIDYEYFVIYSE